MKKLKKKKLKNLSINSISMVMGENSSPMNPGAKTLFIKSKKEEKNMEPEKSTFLAFLEGIFKKGTVEKAQDNEAPPAETPEKQEVSYVTKADFEQFKTEISDIIKAGIVQKADAEKDSLSEFAKGLHAAYQQDLESLKKSFVKQESIPGDQTGLVDLIRQYSQKQTTPNPAMDSVRKGNVANDFVQKKMDEGKINKNTLPGVKTDFDLVVEAICNTNI